MFIRALTTANPAVRLVQPDVERDAALGVRWLADPHGRDTLRLMGVMEQNNRASTLEQEQHRVRQFLENTAQFNWMIELDGRVVGAIWVDRPTTRQPVPMVSFMIGDPAARGHGVGRAALRAVVEFLAAEGFPRVTARHIVGNAASAALLRNQGFRPIGSPAIDPEDGLTWQVVEQPLP